MLESSLGSEKMKVLTTISLLFLGSNLLVGRDLPLGPRLLDVSHYDIEAEVVPEERFLKGKVQVSFTVLENILSIPFDFSSQLSVIEITDKEGNRYSTRSDDLNSKLLKVQGPRALKSGTNQTLTFHFEGSLEGEEYAFLDVARSEQAVISPENALLLTEGLWFPQYSLPLDSATANVSIKVPLGFTVVAPGNLETIETEGVTEIFTWKSETSLTHIPVVVSRFFRQKFEEESVPVTFYVHEDFKGDLAPWNQEIHDILEFFQKEYGSLPVSKLDFVSVGNVELESPGSFQLVFLESALLKSKRLPLMKLAQRLARHWWGYSVRLKGEQDALLQDGFCTYAALRYIEVNHADDFRSQLARQAVNTLKYEKLAPITNGFSFKSGSSQFASIVGSKGAWVLYMLSQIIGRDEFNSYFGHWYRGQKGREVSIANFVDFIHQKSGDDYGWFFAQWVESIGVPQFQVDYTIYKLKDETYEVRGQVKQDLELFRMPTDLRIETEGKSQDDRLLISGRATSFKMKLQDRPLKVVVDPHGKILNDSDHMRVLVHIALGEEYQEKSEFVVSIQEFEKAKELDPKSSLAAYRLGEVFFQQHSFSNSANAFRESLNGTLQPAWIETWIHIYLGKIYDILGQRERAKSEYRKAVNSKIDYNGAQAEAKKYLEEPFSKPRTISG